MPTATTSKTVKCQQIEIGRKPPTRQRDEAFLCCTVICGRALVRVIAVLVSNETTRASTLQRRTLPPRRRPTALVHPFFLFAVLRQSINSPSNFRDLPNFQNP
jgi:hypothetical protein